MISHPTINGATVLALFLGFALGYWFKHAISLAELDRLTEQLRRLRQQKIARLQEKRARVGGTAA